MSNLPRQFNVGRQSELLYNEELYKIHESVKHLTDDPGPNAEPQAKLDGAAWHDKRKNALKWFDKTTNKWRKYYENEFKITGEITSMLPPTDAIKGQLWLHNEVLCYFDGVDWKPVKALMQDGSQFSLDVFKNFILLSPLWKIGNTVIEDSQIAEFEKAERQYLQNILDAKTDSPVTGDGTKWTTDHKCVKNDPQLTVFSPDSKCQLLVPNIDFARMFIDRDLDIDKYEEVSKVCVQYKRQDLAGRTPSLIHLNPGRLTKLTKKLVMIDRVNPRIQISAANTEFYGFRSNSYYGEFLLPDSDQGLMDYTIVEDGILLNYSASQSYDYVLAVTYEFSWMKSTGRMAKVNSADATNSYYVDNYRGPLNVFVEGLDIEDPYFDSDSLSQTITIKEDTSKLEVSMMHTPQREYGYIRQIDLQDRGVIHPLRTYTNPLVFVNGEAIHPTLQDIVFDTDGLIYIPGAKQDMMWSVIELYDQQNDFDAFCNAGKVDSRGVVSFDSAVLTTDESVVLFIDGLLVKKESLIIDRVKDTISVNGSKLSPGQEYILLRDKYNWLYDEKMLVPALSLGKFSDSMVYFNKKLICNSTAIDTFTDETQLAGVYNEVKCFKVISLDASNNEIISCTYKVYDHNSEKWKPLNVLQEDGLKFFAYAYENMPRSIRLLLPYTKQDNIQTYAFNMANEIEHPLIVKSIDVHNQKNIPTISPYLYGANSLRVWCNGVRIYPQTDKIDGVVEYLDGNSFDLPEAFTGKVTYVIERPEKNAKISCTMEILDNSNLKFGHINAYTTKQSLFPGRANVYINGVRQATDSYTILDNHTLLINGDTALIGSSNNYPTERIVDGDKEYLLNRKQPDYILVEIRQDERKEICIECKDHPAYEINIEKYDIDTSILEAADEIMIFSDGLYYGPTSLDGYIKNTSRTTLSITQDEILSTINSDEEYQLLKANMEEQRNYLTRHEAVPYKQYKASLILEWR